MQSLETVSAFVSNPDNSYSYTTNSPILFKWCHVVYTSTATVGNRLVALTVTDKDGNTVYSVRAGAVQAASNVYHYVFQPGVYREGSFTNSEIQVAVAEGILEAGWTMTIADENGVDASDSFDISFQGQV